MYLIAGTVGLVGLIFYAAIIGGGLGPFLDLPSFAIVVGGAFFATLAMSRGKFNQETVSFFGKVSPIALLTVLYGLIVKLVCSAWAASMMQGK